MMNWEFRNRLKRKLSFLWLRQKKKVITCLSILVFFMTFVIVWNTGFGTVVTIAIEQHRLGRLDQQDFLEDFDFFVEQLTQNFPFFEIYSEQGEVDLISLAASTRAVIENHQGSMDAIDFYNILVYHFFDPITGEVHNRNFGNLNIVTIWDMANMLFDTLTTSVEAGSFEEVHWSSVAYASIQPRTMSFYTALSEETIGRSLFLDSRHRRVLHNDLRLDVIEADRIARITMNDMPFGSFEAWTRISHFYRNINHFDHLIIDLRGNSGGFTQFFDGVVLAPLVRGSISVLSYVYFFEGDNNMEFFGNDRLPIYVQSLGVPYNHFDQVLRINHRVANPTGRQMLPNAQIWLLVDEHTAHTAEQAVMLMKYSDIATVVGNATQGSHSHISSVPMIALITLPNTGILISYDFGFTTDADGRPLTGEGIAPHYANMPGKDAFETVMYMIDNL